MSETQNIEKTALSDFSEWITTLKAKIRSARNKLAFSNLIVLLQWYKFYSEKYQFVPHVVAQIPWGHNRLIINNKNTIFAT